MIWWILSDSAITSVASAVLPAPRLQENRHKGFGSEDAVHRLPLAEWQVIDSIGKVFRFTSQGEDFQVADALPNGHLELMRVDNASKRFPTFLTLGCFAQQIVVLSE